MSTNQLIQTLQQKVEQLCLQYAEQAEQKIFTKFDRSLFSENFQSVDFYIKEIEQTLAQLQTLPQDSLPAVQFVAERLLAQCTALSEGLQAKKSQSVPKSALVKPAMTAKQKAMHEIHQLPPRERLEKYYEALHQLTEKYNQAKDLVAAAINNAERQRYTAAVQSLQQRREKCLEAIDLLEEYLTFQKQQEQQTKSQTN